MRRTCALSAAVLGTALLVPTAMQTATATPADKVSGPAAVTRGSNGRIAFVSDRDGTEQIYAMSADGTRTVRLTDPLVEADSFDPVFSPDGTQIAFASNRDGNEEIYVMGADGSDPTRLTYNSSYDAQPAFSPDGQLIVFTSNRGGNSEIYRMRVDGTHQVPLTDSGEVSFEPSYSPDGLQIVYTRVGTPTTALDIYRMQADGSGESVLFSTPYFGTGDVIDDQEAEYSPTGANLVVVSGRDGNAELYRTSSSGALQARLTINAATESSPTYSPDGQQVVFTSDRNGTQDIYRYTGSANTATRLTSNPSNDFDPTWGPSYVECLGQPATITGTTGNDSLVGTPGPDVIAGLGGDDVIQGLEGADVICGGAGIDYVTYADHEAAVTANLTGGTGDDGSVEDGSPGARDSIGKDVEGLGGGLGDDILVGSSGDNELFGAAGDDVVIGGVGNDALYGASGDDTVRGDDGDDFMSGGTGADALYGGEDVDDIDGDSGADDLNGGEGADLLEGGTGGDIFRGGPDIDTVSYGDHGLGVVASIDAGAGDDGNKSDGGVGERDTILRSVENLQGGSAPDTLTGSSGDNTITGGYGADTLLGLAGTDLLVASDGVKDTKLDCGADNDYPAQRDAIDPAAVSCTGATPPPARGVRRRG